MEEADSGGYRASPGGEQCGGSPADVQDHGLPLARPPSPASRPPAWPRVRPRTPGLGVPRRLLPWPLLPPGGGRPLPPEAVPLQAEQPRVSGRGHSAAPQPPRAPAPSPPAAPAATAGPRPTLPAHSFKYSAGDVQWRPEVIPGPGPVPSYTHEAGLRVAPEAIARLCRAISSLHSGLVKWIIIGLMMCIF